MIKVKNICQIKLHLISLWFFKDGSLILFGKFPHFDLLPSFLCHRSLLLEASVLASSFFNSLCPIYITLQPYSLGFQEISDYNWHFTVLRYYKDYSPQGSSLYYHVFSASWELSLALLTICKWHSIVGTMAEIISYPQILENIVFKFTSLVSNNCINWSKIVFPFSYYTSPLSI